MIWFQMFAFTGIFDQTCVTSPQCVVDHEIKERKKTKRENLYQGTFKILLQKSDQDLHSAVKQRA